MSVCTAMLEDAWFKDPASSTGLGSILIKLLSSGLMPAIWDPAESKNGSPPLAVFTSSPFPSLHRKEFFQILCQIWRSWGMSEGFSIDFFLLYLYKSVLFSKYLSSSVELSYWIFSKIIQPKVDSWRNFHINSLFTTL